MSDTAESSQVTWQQRYQEWQALLGYLTENREELEAKSRMTALVLCLQRHYQDMRRLRGEDTKHLWSRVVAYRS